MMNHRIEAQVLMYANDFLKSESAEERERICREAGWYIDTMASGNERMILSQMYMRAIHPMTPVNPEKRLQEGEEWEQKNDWRDNV